MNSIIRTVAPLGVIALGVLVAVVFVATRQPPERADPEPVSTRVRVQTVALTERPVRVAAMGTVLAAQKVELHPEVAGRVVGQHPQLLPGGVVRAGETLVRIDPRDYRLALEDAKAQLQKAEFDLAMEKGKQKIARREFELLRSDQDLSEEEYALALRKPHLKNAEAALTAAKSRIDRARLDIDRTVVSAPFNAIVQREAVDLGQLVTAQSSLATLVGTDAFWVQVSVPVSALDWLETEGSSVPRVEIRHDRGRAEPVVKTGEVLRLLGDLEPKGRMARILVRVEDPLDLRLEPRERQPLLLGSYVQVMLQGRSAGHVAVLPRRALREDDRVWILGVDGRLEIRAVTTSYRGRNEVYVDSGLGDGDLVVTSRIAAPVPGMALRRQGSGATEIDATTARIED